MKLKHTVQALSFGAMLGLAALSGPALADDQGPRWWEPMIKKMSTPEGMMMKKDFMRMMEMKFDEMDKGKKGMLSQQDVMKIFSDKTGT